MIYEWPQIIMLIFIGINIGVSVYKYSISIINGSAFTVNIIALVITNIILYYGGFWT